MKASKAKEITENALPELLKSLEYKVYDKIKSVAALYKFSYTFHQEDYRMDLMEKLFPKFKENGYSITYSKTKNEKEYFCITLHWGGDIWQN